ncbi:MAG: DUF4199 domain-containing protein [Chitinophagales bacterium]
MSNNSVDNIDFSATTIKFAIIGSIVHVLFCLLFYFSGLKSVAWKDVPFLILNVCLIILYIKEISSKMEYKSFGLLFKNGFTLSLFFALTALVFVVLYLNLIDLNYPDDMFVSTKETLEKFGMNADKVEAAMEKESIKSPSYFYLTAFFTKLFCCTIISAIGAAVFKKEQ